MKLEKVKKSSIMKSITGADNSPNKKEFFSNYSKIARKVSKYKVGENGKIDKALQEAISSMARLKDLFKV